MSSIAIQVKLMTGDLIQVDCQLDSSILQIKSFIQDACPNLLVHRQRLLRFGPPEDIETPTSNCSDCKEINSQDTVDFQELEDGKSLGYYHISEDEILFLFLKPSIPEACMTFSVFSASPSNRQSKKLEAPTPTELIITDDTKGGRAATCSEPLPSKFPSSWAVEVRSIGYVHIGLLDKPRQFESSYDHFFGVCGWSAVPGEGYWIESKSPTYDDELAVEPGDIVLFEFLPNLHELHVANPRSGGAVRIPVLKWPQVYLTAYLTKGADGELSHLVLRVTTEEEDAILERLFDRNEAS